MLHQMDQLDKNEMDQFDKNVKTIKGTQLFHSHEKLIERGVTFEATLNPQRVHQVQMPAFITEKSSCISLTWFAMDKEFEGINKIYVAVETERRVGVPSTRRNGYLC